MAFPIFIPDHLVVPAPPEHMANNLVKHLVMKGEEFQSFTYKPIQESFILQYLRKLKGSEVIDTIMIVKFRQNNDGKEDASAMNVVRRGVCLEGACYRFLGHSDSQLLEKTCLLIHDSDLAIYDYFEKFADFSNFSSVSKRAECIGVLFAGFDKKLSLSENDYFKIEDIKRRGTSFSSGCGYMSMQFATEIKQLEALDYTPSVARVVYQGYSGILAIRSDLNMVKVEFRESMRKFSFAHKDLFSSMNSVGLVDYSRPYTNGYLDTQDVMLLTDGGISRDYLSQLQQEYFSLLENLCTSKSQASYYLQTTGHADILRKLSSEGIEAIQEDLERLQQVEIQKIKGGEKNEEVDGSLDLSKTPKTHLKILVPKSRVVFGVCDPYELLEYDECYFNPTMSKEEEKEFSEVDRVVVFRESSYYPGDVRVLKVQRKHPDFDHHKDYIVFPVQGPRPLALECGGEDRLDGDKFFVSWDANLIPRWRTSPYSYVPNTIAHLGGRLYEQGFQLRFRERTKDYFRSVFGHSDNYARDMKIKQRQDLAEYFASYDSNLLNKFSTIFMKYASALGPSSKQCRHLHHSFSRAVSGVGKGEELERIITQYETEYKNLSRPVSKPRRCCLVNLLIRNGWIKPFFDPGDDVWNVMEKNTQGYLQRLHDDPKTNTQSEKKTDDKTEDQKQSDADENVDEDVKEREPEDSVKGTASEEK